MKRTFIRSGAIASFIAILLLGQPLSVAADDDADTGTSASNAALELRALQRERVQSWLRNRTDPSQRRAEIREFFRARSEILSRINSSGRVRGRADFFHRWYGVAQGRMICLSNGQCYRATSTGGGGDPSPSS